MKFRMILTLSAALLVALSVAPVAGLAQGLGATAGIPAGVAPAAMASGSTDARGNDIALEMGQAFRQGQRSRLTQLLPGLRGHLLEPWGAYWELRARLDAASAQEVQAFLARYAGTYQEDRLRNDWLLLLGERRDWSAFAEELPRFRMNDDPQVRCYALLVRHLREGPSAEIAQEVRRLWMAQRGDDDGCTAAARALAPEGRDGREPRQARAGHLTAVDLWRRARLAAEFNRVRLAQAAVEIIAPSVADQVPSVVAQPARFLDSRITAPSRARRELVVLALARLAATDLEGAIHRLDSKWSVHLDPEERAWLWGVVGRQAALKLSSDALGYFERAGREAELTDDMLAWKARAALRAGTTPRWKALMEAVEAMSPQAQQDPAWTYWRARALMASGNDAERAAGRQLLVGLASVRGFYEQLALEDLGQRITLPARPQALTAEERDAARRNPGLQRALHAIAIGLRADGVREWNYTTNLARPGGMADRELLAAAQLACEREVWDRCINTSERTRADFDVEQRFPTPLREPVMRRSRDIGLDPAYVYGLIRQESRFITDARSHVGASGLMQVMPATGRWTARRIGMTGFTPEQLNDRDVNLAIGTAYLKLVLDDFDGSVPLAAAAYNAGPGRPRAWRNGPTLEGAVWAENVPFNETRDYVKKVLANATVYAALLTGQPQSLRARLGTVGPRDPARSEPNRDLP